MNQIDQTEIEAILDRSQDGVTHPFFCRCSDGECYFVKGRDAGAEALCCEAIAGQIAVDFDLPMPPFRIVSIPPELTQYSVRDDINDLGDGLAWGVRNVENAVTYSVQNRALVYAELQAKILLFDWFVKNDDRSLSNPNMLWSERDRKLTIIDHTLAFNRAFDRNAFWQKHAFHEVKDKLWKESFRINYEKLVEECIVRLPGYWELIPSEWLDRFGESLDTYRVRVELYLREPVNNPEQFWSGSR